MKSIYDAGLWQRTRLKRDLPNEKAEGDK